MEEAMEIGAKVSYLRYKARVKILSLKAFPWILQL